MANWLTYRIRVGDDVLVLADEEAQELIKNETERSKKADAQIASFLESTTTNGIIRNSKSDPFGQTAIGGMKVVIDEGDLIINGNIKNHTRLTRTYNVMQENRTEVFLYRFDSVTNEITGLWRDCIIQGDIILSREDKTELPLRSSGYYDILICKITIPAGATEITQDMIGDFRQNEYYCGYAKNLLVDIDETLTKSDAAADAAAVGAVISDLRNETRTRDIITEKRITNLEAGLPAERWSVDDSVAYTKEVPENALPFASVDMIGGITRKCTNLIYLPDTETDIVGVHVKIVGGAVTVSGTATASGGRLSTLGVVTLQAGTYVSRGNGFGYFSRTTDNMIIGQTNGIPFTLEEEATLKFGLNFTAGKAYSETFSVTLNEGTEPLPYEPYFDGLRSAPVTEVESVGANQLPYPFKQTTTTTNGITFTDNGDGSVTVNGEATGFTAFLLWSGEESFAGCFLSGTPAGDGYVYIRARASDGTLYRSYNKGIYLEKAVVEIYIIVTSSGVVANNVVLKPMLNVGETALPYTPYVKRILPVPAAVQALDGYGWGINADCYNYIDWEKKQFVKRVGVMSAASIGWQGMTSNLAYSLKLSKPNAKCVCALPSGFKNIIFDDQGAVVVYFDEGRFLSIPEISAALSGVMLYYELAEPVITDISDLLHEDNLIGVEGGGTVTMVNEYGYDVPSEITYQLKGAEA